MKGRRRRAGVHALKTSCSAQLDVAARSVDFAVSELALTGTLRLSSPLPLAALLLTPTVITRSFKADWTARIAVRLSRCVEVARSASADSFGALMLDCCSARAVRYQPYVLFKYLRCSPSLTPPLPAPLSRSRLRSLTLRHSPLLGLVPSPIASPTLPNADLTEPVDIYSEWLDACQEVNPPNDVGGEGHEHSVSPPPAAPRRLQKKRPAEGSDDEAGAGGGGGSDEEEDLPDFRRKKGRVERSDDEGEGEEAEPRRKQQVVEDDEDDE